MKKQKTCKHLHTTEHFYGYEDKCDAPYIYSCCDGENRSTEWMEMSEAFREDVDGVQWCTKGYLESKVIIAREDERNEIIDWLEKQISICDSQLYHEQTEKLKSLWLARKKAFEDTKRYIEGRSPLKSSIKESD